MNHLEDGFFLFEQARKHTPEANGHFPEKEIVIQEMSSMTAVIAATVKQQILEIHATGQPTGKKERIALIDTAAAAVMEHKLADMPFSVVSVGSEGAKEQLAGKMGVAMPTVLGRFGGGNGEVWMVNDPVEGTTAAAANNPGAISVVAVGAKDGLMATPDGVHYMDKLFVPPKAAGKVNIDQPPRRNLIAVCDAYGVGPDEVTVVVMNRPRNAHIIEELRTFGANLELIEHGDLVPSLLAILPPESHTKGIHMLMGIGGWEEGVIAATAARALGGVAEGRAWKEDAPHQPKLTLDDLVPGKAEQSMVIYSAITDDEWFDIPGATEDSPGMVVETIRFDSTGVSRGNFHFTGD